MEAYHGFGGAQDLAGCSQRLVRRRLAHSRNRLEPGRTRSEQLIDRSVASSFESIKAKPLGCLSEPTQWHLRNLTHGDAVSYCSRLHAHQIGQSRRQRLDCRRQAQHFLDLGQELPRYLHIPHSGNVPGGRDDTEVVG